MPSVYSVHEAQKKLPFMKKYLKRGEKAVILENGKPFLILLLPEDAEPYSNLPNTHISDLAQKEYLQGVETTLTEWNSKEDDELFKNF